MVNDLMKAVICSKNPIKINAVNQAFSMYFSDFDLISIKMPANNHGEILSQPMSREETIESAINRTTYAKTKVNGDLYIALEGGIAKDSHGAYLTGYVYIINKEGKDSLAGGYRMPLPLHVYSKLEKNPDKELGDIIDQLSNDHNTKQKGGAVALFTKNQIQREDVFRQAVIFALIPFFSKYWEKQKKKRY